MRNKKKKKNYNNNNDNNKKRTDIRRDNRPELKKAGNLRYAFNRTHGEIIVIFDADFCPRPEFLRETTPYFAQEDVAILQTPQFFRSREEQTWVERGAGVTQELFYRMVQVNRNVGTARSSCSCVNGSYIAAQSEWYMVHSGCLLYDRGFVQQ